MVLINIVLVANGVELFSICLLAMWQYTFTKCLLTCFVHFLLGCLSYICRNSYQILHISPLSDLFSHCVLSVLSLSGSSDEQKALNFT